MGPKPPFLTLANKADMEVQTTKDSHTKSLYEALINSFGAYPVGYFIGIIILPMSLGWLEEDPYVANIAIALVYTTASFVRVYILRRVFLRIGIDDNFIKLGIKLFKKYIKVASTATTHQTRR